MKQRIITAIAIILVVGAPLYFGGILLDILVCAFTLVGCYEFISIRKKGFNYLLYIIMLLFIGCIVILDSHYTLALVVGLIFTLFLLAILFEDISMEDVSSVFLISLILGLATKSIFAIYTVGGMLMIYIAVAAFGCDTGAYFFGYFFGKHKLNPRVSPKKTIEGSIGGWLCGFVLSYGFAMYFIPEFFPNMFYLFMSITLPIVSQLGDLSFSLIKRNYNAKDFGSIFPSHGGVLDRIDSLLFCLVYFLSMMVVL